MTITCWQSLSDQIVSSTRNEIAGSRTPTDICRLLNKSEALS